MKGVFTMGMLQDLNRISIAKQMPFLYRKTSEIILACRASDNTPTIVGISSISDEDGHTWDISAKIYNTKRDCIVDNFLSLKCQPLNELVAYLYATSVQSPEKIDLGCRRVVSCVGNKDAKNDNAIYFFVTE